MRLLTVECQQCGAPVEVPVRMREANCAFCGGHVVLQTTESDAAQRVAENTEALRRQAELERIDREWQLNKERFYVRGQDGEMSVPSKAASLIGGIVVVGFGIIWTVMATGIAGIGIGFGGRGFGAIAGIFPCFGLLFIGMGIAIAVRNYSKASDFESLQNQYHHDRRRAMDDLKTFDR